MNKKTTDILAYITPIGLILAFVAGDRDKSRFHLNQALVIWLAGIVFGVIGIIPVVGGIIGGIGGVVCLIFAILGIIGAVKGEESPLPFIGGIKLYK